MITVDNSHAGHDQPQIVVDISDSGDRAARVPGAGSLFQIHWTTLPVTDARCAHTGDTDLNLLTFLGLCNRGIHVSMRGMAALSTPMSEDHVEALIGAFDQTLAELRSEGWW